MTIYGWRTKQLYKIESLIVDVHRIQTTPKSYEVTGMNGDFDGRWFATFSAAQQAAIEDLTVAVDALHVSIYNVRKQRKSDVSVINLI